MKLSTTTFILSIVTSRTLGIPLLSDNYADVVERDISQDYELEARSFNLNINNDLYDRNFLDAIDDLELRSYDDFELANRAIEVDVEARAANMGGTGRGAGGADIGNAIVNLIEGIKKEPKARGDFVKSLIDGIRKSQPGAQAIVCHTKHDYKFNGERGKDWGHSHAEWTKDATPGTIGFEIYWFKKGGWFENKGDGGWQNWGYTGSPKKQGDKKLTY